MNQFTVTRYPHGTFCWADCSSNDPEKARKFYSRVMGWTSEDRPIGEGQFYTMFQYDGHEVAGMSHQQQAGVPSVWNCYIAVDEVDILMNMVTALGGTVIAEPFDVMDSGRMAIIQDPTGAVVCLWQAYSHIGSELVNTTGAFTWNELATADLQKACDFYSQLLGWTFQDGPIPNYLLFFVNDRVNGGMTLLDEQQPDAAPHWSVCFSIGNVGAAKDAVVATGGQVIASSAEDASEWNYFVASDPGGAMVTLMQVNNPEPWIEALA